MTKSQARVLLRILAAKRIKFRMERDGETFSFFFDPKYAAEVRSAAGTL